MSIVNAPQTETNISDKQAQLLMVLSVSHGQIQPALTFRMVHMRATATIAAPQPD